MKLDSAICYTAAVLIYIDYLPPIPASTANAVSCLHGGKDNHPIIAATAAKQMNVTDR
ncbi:hypothetical protein [Candidatus Berkiella aquae]|nr:hypothetical protein [Candidatus Berkiella aquae]MCS5712122.1 hypothetical protein [Candidatus Berkiella aquae]